MGAPMRYQPQASVRLNRSNPITRGLVVVLHPMQPGINLADGSPMVDAYGQGSSWTPAVNSVGRAIANNSSPNYRIYSNGSWTAQNGSTTVVVATPRALVTSGAQMLEWSGAGGWNTVSLYMGDGTNPRWMAGTNASGLQYTTAPSNYAVGVPQTIVATATSNAQNLVINGAIVASTAYATGNPGYAHAFTLHSPSATAKVVEVNLVLCWNRALTNDEAVSLSNNPWQIFDAGSASSSYQSAIASTGTTSSGATATLTGDQATSAAGSIAAGGGASAALTGNQATSGAGSVTAGGSATAALTGNQATSGAGTMAGAGTAGTTVTGVQGASGVGTVTATAGGGATVALTGDQSTGGVGALSGTGGASVTIAGDQAQSGVGSVTGVAGGGATVALTGDQSTGGVGAVVSIGGASVALVGDQSTAGVGTVVGSGMSNNATAYLSGVSASTSVGAASATGTSTGVNLSVTEDDICRAVRSYIKGIAPSLPALRTPVNMAAMPKCPYVSFTPGMRRALSTNVREWDLTTTSITQPEQMGFMVNCYGDGAANLAETLRILFRDQYGVDTLGPVVAPLYAGPVQASPFVNDANQYESCYALEIEVQINPSIIMAQQSCNMLNVTLINVDRSFK